MFRNSLYWKIMVVFSCILVTLFILTFLIFHLGTTTLSQKTTEAIDIHAGYSFSSFSHDMQRIQDVVYSFGYDSDVITLAYKGQYLDSRERATSLTSLSRKTALVASLSQYISMVQFNMPLIDRTLYGSDNQLVTTLDSERYDRLFDYITETGHNLYLEEEEIICIYYNLTAGEHKTVDQYILEIHIDRDKLMDLLQAQIVYDNSICYLLDAYGNQVLSTSDVSPVMADDIKRYKELRYISEGDFPKLEMVLRVPYSSINRDQMVFTVLFSIFTLTAIICASAYIIYCYRLVRKPFKEIIDATYQIEKGNFDVQLKNYDVSELNALSKRFQSMSIRLGALIDQVYYQKILMQKSELRQLQSQINPHFLYNSFFILSRMIQSESNEQAEQLLEHLANYYRYINRDHEMTVSLQDEYNHMLEYTHIQKIRFPDKVTIEFAEIPATFVNLPAPRLILQPVVENYFAYANPTPQKCLHLRFSIRKSSRILELVFEDNLCHMDSKTISHMNHLMQGEKEPEKMTGLINISRRLMLTYGSQFFISLESAGDQGLRTVLRLGIQEENKN